MDKDLSKGLKIGFGFLGAILITSILFFSLVYAVGFHPPSEVISGLFTGDYEFNGTVNLTNSNLYGVDYNDLKKDSFNCPANYSKVTGNFTLGTQDFCVMKYEAKNVSNIATSTSTATPWVNLPWQQARAECSKLGSSYHLITDDEWLTIANNVVQQPSNWFGGVVGTNFIWSGHNDNGPTNTLAADASDANGYSGTGDSASSCDGVYSNFVIGDDVITGRACVGQKRTLTLSTGDVIWDFSGNVYEWTDKIIPIEERYHGGVSSWMTYNNDGGLIKAKNVPYFMVPPNSWDADNSMGRYFDGANVDGAYCDTLGCTAGYNSKSTAFLRSGNWGNGPYAGVFTLHLSTGPSLLGEGYGFRCVYAP